MTHYVALLRGINVGGNNIIPMVELRDCFSKLKFSNVTTYIQSGNVLFTSRSKNINTITRKIERALSDRFSYSARVVVIDKQTYRASLQHAPKNWGKREGQKHNAMFTIGGADIEELLTELPPLVKSIESASHSPDVLFWSVSQDKAGKSSMMKLAKSPAYKKLTVRNHKTFFKLMEMFDSFAEKN